MIFKTLGLKATQLRRNPEDWSSYGEKYDNPKLVVWVCVLLMCVIIAELPTFVYVWAGFGLVTEALAASIPSSADWASRRDVTASSGYPRWGARKSDGGEERGGQNRKRVDINRTRCVYDRDILYIKAVISHTKVYTEIKTHPIHSLRLLIRTKRTAIIQVLQSYYRFYVNSENGLNRLDYQHMSFSNISDSLTPIVHTVFNLWQVCVPKL